MPRNLAVAYSYCIALLSVISVHWIQIDQLINFRFSWLLNNPHCTQLTRQSLHGNSR